MSVKEIAAIAVEPVNKLIDAVSCAIGKAYEPRYVRKMADAKAHEIKVISEELRNNADLPIVYDGTTNMCVDMSDFEALAKRAGRRIAYQEVAKQQNIENIVDSACDSLHGIHEVSDKEISREWMNRFLDSAADITTEELQKIWSKVLAGEVVEPTSFSLRTLECLRNLDVNDAKLFERACRLCINKGLIINDNSFLRENHISFDDILKLDECGLINSSGMIYWRKELGENLEAAVDFGDYILMAKKGEKSLFELNGYPFTAAGRELRKIVNVELSLNLVKQMCRIIQKQNPQICISLHLVNYRKEEVIDYQDEPVSFIDDTK